MPNLVNENKQTSLIFKATFASKLKLLKRNSFILNIMGLTENWLDANIDKIYRRGGKAFLENHLLNKE